MHVRVCDWGVVVGRVFGKFECECGASVLCCSRFHMLFKIRKAGATYTRMGRRSLPHIRTMNIG